MEPICKTNQIKEYLQWLGMKIINKAHFSLLFQIYLHLVNKINMNHPQDLLLNSQSKEDRYKLRILMKL